MAPQSGGLCSKEGRAYIYIYTHDMAPQSAVLYYYFFVYFIVYIYLCIVFQCLDQVSIVS